jgi:gluconate:H+ symporter, GntP family
MTQALTLVPQLIPLAAGQARLIVVAIIAFAMIIVLITWLKMNPFLALMIGSVGLGLSAGLAADKTVTRCRSDLEFDLLTAR